MEENENSMETLLERAKEYGKASIELMKLKAIDKVSDVVSTFIPRLIIWIFVLSFLLFLNLGAAFWLGEILENISYGFFAVAAFYGFVVIIILCFLRGLLKKMTRNCFIKQVLK